TIRAAAVEGHPVAVVALLALFEDTVAARRRAAHPGVAGKPDHEVAIGVRRLEAALDLEAGPLLRLRRSEAPVDAAPLRGDPARDAIAAAGDAGKRPVGAAPADGRPRNLASRLQALPAQGS